MIPKQLSSFIVFVLLLGAITSSYAQKKMPDFQFLDTDRLPVSTKDIGHGKPLLLIYFRSDCDHCIHTAQLLKDNVSSYPVEIWMVSAESIDALRMFEDMSGFYDVDKVKVLQDHTGSMHKWYDFTQLPFIVLFDKNGKEIKTFAEFPTATSIRKVLTGK